MEKLDNGAKSRKKKFEFSKFLVTWALVLTSVCVLISYTLAFLDHETCSDITISVASACIAIGVAYQAKSFGEKNSRNKYGLDDNGMPIHHAEEETRDGDGEDSVG